MLINPWSIALVICSGGVLFLIGLASITALKVLFFWDGNSDTEEQIELEGRTWLAAALVQNGLAVQILSLFLLVLAADDFANMIAGAMCATGSFLANDYGTKSLYIKIAGIFLYGFWIVLHRLDLRSEYAPLLRLKFGYLLVLVPVVLFDSYYLISYLYYLEPDIITSCCGVIFSQKGVKEDFLMMSFSVEIMVVLFYLVGAFLIFGTLLGFRSSAWKNGIFTDFNSCMAILWLIFFFLSLLTITTFFSSYIYAMPYHKCPFDILHKEYHYIGIPIYLSLFITTFLGMSGSGAALLRARPGLLEPVSTYQEKASKVSLVMLLVFIILVTAPAAVYIIAGGEI